MEVEQPLAEYTQKCWVDGLWDQIFGEEIAAALYAHCSRSLANVDVSAMVLLEVLSMFIAVVDLVCL
jgi:hypothetical protein